MTFKALTKLSLATFLSFLSSCAELPKHPQGWSCTLSYNHGTPGDSVFVCNEIVAPNTSKTFPIGDPMFKNAHCMDLKSFRAYSEYVFKLRDRLIACELSGL